MIFQALHLHEGTIIRHLNDYREGKLGLASGGSTGRLSGSETQSLIAHLDAHTYHHVHDVLAYVENRWSMTYTTPGINKWLHRNGFTDKKPKGVPYKADKEKQVEFIQTYSKLKATLNPGDSVYFGDSFHPSQATKLSYGWIKKGEDKKVGTTASRTRLIIIGALKLENIGSNFVASYLTINAEAISEHFRLVRKQHGRSGTVYLILDRAPYHRAEFVIG